MEFYMTVIKMKLNGKTKTNAVLRGVALEVATKNRKRGPRPS